jgi:MFS superfamily sulfate permease-like transporter
MKIKIFTPRLSITALSVFFGLLPLAVYWFERGTGILSDANTWYATGTNHGPWRWQLEGALVYYPLVAMAVITAIVYLVKYSKEQKRKAISEAGLLLELQFIGH